MEKLLVQDVMTRKVIAAREDTPFKELVRLMSEHRVSGVPVLNAEDRLAGIVTEADLLAVEGEPEPRQRSAFLEWFIHPSRLAEIERRSEDVRAADIMTRKVVTVGPETPVEEAVRVLLDAGVKRLPVVSEDGEVLGIVSRRDLLQPFLRADDDIRREITEDVVLGAMWIDPSTVDVQVSHGVVHLKGEVERRSDKEILVAFVHRVPGVVGVEDELTFKVDDREIQPPPPRETPHLQTPFRRR